MASQPLISDLFRKKKPNACLEAFNSQFNALNTSDEQNNVSFVDEEISYPPDCSDHLSNIEKLQISEANLIQENEKNETKINALENQVKLLSEKYEKLKVKHVNLLQTLLAKENQIQSLNLKIINEREPNISNGLEAGEVMHSECVSLQNVSIDQLNLKKKINPKFENAIHFVNPDTYGCKNAGRMGRA